MVVLEEIDRALRPLDHLVGGQHRVAVESVEKTVAFFDGEAFVDAPGDRACPVNFLSGRGRDDFLPVFAHHDALHGQVLVLQCHADYVANRRVGIDTEQQVGRNQVEEVKCVRLEYLPVVHQSPHLLAGGREAVAGSCSHHDIQGLCGGQMVTDGADAAESLHQHRGFPVRTSLYETLKAAEFDNVESALRYPVLSVKLDCYFPVSFNPRYGFYCDFSRHGMHRPRLRLIEFHQFIR